jgi:hypothetical protein
MNELAKKCANETFEEWVDSIEETTSFPCEVSLYSFDGNEDIEFVSKKLDQCKLLARSNQKINMGLAVPKSTENKLPGWVKSNV